MSQTYMKYINLKSESSLMRKCVFDKLDIPLIEQTNYEQEHLRTVKMNICT